MNAPFESPWVLAAGLASSVRDADVTFDVPRDGRVLRLGHFATVFDGLIGAVVDRVVLVGGPSTLAPVLREHDRFVFAMNHGPAHLPLVAVAAMGRLVSECGGADLRTIGILFRPLYFVPVLRRVMRYLTQVDATPSFDELVEGFESGRLDGVVVMPEGANCVFGEPGEIQPFASPRFVELAARVDAPIVLVVHRGLERFARSIRMPASIRSSRLVHRLPFGIGRGFARAEVFALPYGLGRLPELRVRIAVHRPSKTSAEFEAMDRDARRAWVSDEARRVHATMVALHDALGCCDEHVDA